jgi:hypothetical protein
MIIWRRILGTKASFQACLRKFGRDFCGAEGPFQRFGGGFLWRRFILQVEVTNKFLLEKLKQEKNKMKRLRK